ncbi:peptide chain release factor N(5)-glutamine methyltransferase [Psychroflexus salis]|uniref:peptide chain release factor N(5)-glutamine methyltransferase n=1 Tax=Psychroflexus salis TaxID=1526574 RepID=A0A916ZTP7_9FLAO|nr:peptide chain release factor N(5)-glutamine methyltransferase [Psychroflexus salis]GGE12101.1 release factor glutamine methyltransferase [Psychroflexus salis]
MKLKELQSQFAKELTEIYPKTEIRTFLNWLVEAYLGWNTTQMLLNSQEELAKEKVQLFQEALSELKKQKPIQYILGETEFYALPFKVNASVLIPRPETEELVDWIIEDYTNTTEKIDITEIGTGSGCIATSLAKNNTNFRLTAYDISTEALAIAEQNAKLNQVTINFKQQDILQLQQLPDQVDVLVSNPPYVKMDERKLIRSNVFDYEPHLALFVENDSALIFYEKIIELALQQEKIPTVYVEINQALGDETRALFENAGFKDVSLKKDIFHKPRMIKAIF